MGTQVVVMTRDILMGGINEESVRSNLIAEEEHCKSPLIL
jgi:hypothetical protein